MKQDTWFGYECYNCTEGSGVLLDLRFSAERDTVAPAVSCPICLNSMEFKSRWLADESGYGSRGDRTAS